MANDSEEVHDPRFGDGFVFAEQPERLVGSAGDCCLLRDDGWAVVGAGFAVPNAAGPGAYGVGHGLEGDGFEASAIVWAYRTGDYVE